MTIEELREANPQKKGESLMDYDWRIVCLRYGYTDAPCHLPTAKEPEIGEPKTLSELRKKYTHWEPHYVSKGKGRRQLKCRLRMNDGYTSVDYIRDLKKYFPKDYARWEISTALDDMNQGFMTKNQYRSYVTKIKKEYGLTTEETREFMRV